MAAPPYSPLPPPAANWAASDGAGGIDDESLDLGIPPVSRESREERGEERRRDRRSAARARTAAVIALAYPRCPIPPPPRQLPFTGLTPSAFSPGRFPATATVPVIASSTSNAGPISSVKVGAAQPPESPRGYGPVGRVGAASSFGSTGEAPAVSGNISGARGGYGTRPYPPTGAFGIGSEGSGGTKFAADTLDEPVATTLVRAVSEVWRSGSSRLLRSLMARRSSAVVYFYVLQFRDLKGIWFKLRQVLLPYGQKDILRDCKEFASSLFIAADIHVITSNAETSVCL
ncbi:MAG: hypothetical protein BJ554DRAFT_1999 [Olpidium bornovanus]|uniref:Uncharacterized protein n=1 Tax=Olpidium bornovanus TaxID=278681 RepID=A0A8H8DGS0_9FUNG|nr:MAG: hypothetical protein BJ554DRAFT_1999 [Olpidium bornovanus]